ncbi:MAG: 2-oxoacid:acceptor oxidoreductase subunit alpha [Anaerolineae bacterium]|jgi:2-oxoglutarate ferredoxin oxidoreductase subunit alpha|nr:2-oxoacid:acceptor oxidoreductase subunit alpha [Anaerolineae bacterium]MDX9829141.1 2-oxoacid:acceptor oxidoreductase subunit alpha [Anaerolineae bacterium]
MSEPKGLLTGAHFMLGDHAAAEGALLAGCRFFAGYPITPATEIAERMSVRMPQVGGVYIQMEDELASMNAILGGSWAGVKSMTATSGPGFSLMMENLGLGMMLETPCVLVNVQRGGPSTGLPTLVGQQDMMQARWGSHGDYETIALCPTSPQEFFDLTIHAFNLSEKYRLPVLVMADAEVGHMTEKVVIPHPDEIEIVERPQVRRGDIEPDHFRIFRDRSGSDDNGYISPMVAAGEGYRIHVTGLTHDERGYPAMNAEAQEWNIERLVNKIRMHRDDIIKVEGQNLEDAEVVVVSYGISARTSLWPIEQARNEDIRVGYLRLITAWPFPDEIIRKLAKQVRAFVVPEINMGQMVREVERCACGQALVLGANRPGGDILEADLVLNTIRRAAGREVEMEARPRRAISLLGGAEEE